VNIDGMAMSVDLNRIRKTVEQQHGRLPTGQVVGAALRWIHHTERADAKAHVRARRKVFQQCLCVRSLFERTQVGWIGEIMRAQAACRQEIAELAVLVRIHAQLVEVGAAQQQLRTVGTETLCATHNRARTLHVEPDVYLGRGLA
jgi:hypothetical protein